MYTSSPFLNLENEQLHASINGLSKAGGKFAATRLQRTALMVKGTVEKFDAKRGFGFITPDNGGEDAFIHRNQLDGADALTEGDR